MPPSPVIWNFRLARPDDAVEACTVLRRSITELCQADHGNDPVILAAWLANKTPEQVRSWIEANPLGFFVGSNSQGISAVGSVTLKGEIALNYVAPWARYQGVSKSLVGVMERRAAALGHASCFLTSTATAQAFYLACGYENDGEAAVAFGGMRSYPMRRSIG